MKKVKYSVEKSKYDNDWILWRENSSEHGICCRNIFKGDKKKCLEKKKEVGNESKRKSIKIFRKTWKYNKY